MTATIDQDHALLATTARSYFGGFVDNNYLNEQEDSAQGFETARWKQMCELGWTAIGLPGRVGAATAIWHSPQSSPKRLGERRLLRHCCKRCVLLRCWTPSMVTGVSTAFCVASPRGDDIPYCTTG